MFNRWVIFVTPSLSQSRLSKVVSRLPVIPPALKPAAYSGISIDPSQSQTSSSLHSNTVRFWKEPLAAVFVPFRKPPLVVELLTFCCWRGWREIRVAPYLEKPPPPLEVIVGGKSTSESLSLCPECSESEKPGGGANSGGKEGSLPPPTLRRELGAEERREGS